MPLAMLALLLASVPALALSPQREWAEILDIPGRYKRGAAGMFTDAAGDVNADGVPDVMVGAWGASPGGKFGGLLQAGAISVYSGVDGSLIHEWTGPTQGAQLGRGLSRVDDVDGDGFDDVCGGAWAVSGGGGFNNGVVYIWSGATGLPIHTIWGPIDSGLFGRFIRDAGDVDADGIGDVIVGAYASSPNGLSGAGTAYVISGATGAIVHAFEGESTGDGLGRSVSSAGDVDGDGFCDVLVGAWWSSYSGTKAGSVYLFSGADGSQMRRIDGEAPGIRLGRGVSDAGDVNGDGIPDQIAGAYLANFTAPSAGSVYVFSGVDGSVLHRFDGQMARSDLGWFVDGPGDLDGDGLGDILGCAYRSTVNGKWAAGLVYLWSGATGAELFRFEGTEETGELGRSGCAAGDLDGDGTPDLILGESGRNRGYLLEAGGARVFASNLGFDGDGDGLSAVVEAYVGGDDADQDTDDDGLSDGLEALDWRPRLTLADSDGDGLTDGLESGVVSPLPDTDLSAGNFTPDADPSTVTDPLNPDTDGGTLVDGAEDLDGNGAVSYGETDPLDSADDLFIFTVSPLIPGQDATLSFSLARPGSSVHAVWSFSLGKSWINMLGLHLGLQRPLKEAAVLVVDSAGNASVTKMVRPDAPVGLTLYFQGVELDSAGRVRLTAPFSGTVQ